MCCKSGVSCLRPRRRVNNRSGLLRVAAGSGDCKTNKESVLDWNIQGVTGQDGVSGYQIVFETFTPSSSVSPGQALSYTVLCPTGKNVLSGGGPISGRVGDSHPLGQPLANGSGWTVDFLNGAAAGFPQHQLFAICATLGT